MRACRPRRRGGFTLIEAMISMVILAVGVLGIVSMQGASVSASAISQDLTHALNVGERMMELIRLDSLRWNSDADLATDTQLLRYALPATQAVGAQGAWATIPDNVLLPSMAGKKVDRDFRPDTAGSPAWPIGFRYCVFYRLTWAEPPNALRAEVRVAWPKDTGVQTAFSDCRTVDHTDLVNTRSATVSTTVMINPL
jgi:prepilin-type N-terminal cleavage/methylation domain-containing protein